MDEQQVQDQRDIDKTLASIDSKRADLENRVAFLETSGGGFPNIACKLTNSGATTVGNNVAPSVISFDVELWDTAGMHNNVNPTRITATTAGRYLVIGNIWSTQSGDIIVMLQIAKNGAVQAQNVTRGSGASLVPNVGPSVSIELELAVGEYVELYRTGSGAVTNIPAGQVTLSARYLGPN